MNDNTIKIHRNSWHREKAAALAVLTDPRDQAEKILRALDNAYVSGAQAVLSTIGGRGIELVD